ncbi:hypothetical protein HNP52_003116 [Sphingomonas kyeonggiensis]|uniref:LPXTG cell wall anchor domain-containing protein n=1 Tax=Sphingomonas kyeonggiensis TaxID=1268553 RepID=A0A7W7K2V9_9SPHN|nr:hypothetical protein [Sphingomonas kyeonggiensis]MBB4840024.1 hypothetical protein [Sphingomonas kyeonggiensis]
MAAASIAAPLAHAQDAPAPGSGPAPIITPPPSVRPQPQQLPGVIPERFSIAPAPSPTPAPVPTPTPTPAARTATPQPQPQRAAPVARATPAPREAAPVAASPTPAASPASTVVPSPVAQPIPAPQPAQTEPAPEPASATPPWLWAAAGAGGTALLGLGGWLLLGRRRRREEDEVEAYEAEPVAVAAPPLQPPPGLGRATPAPAPAQPAVRAPAPVGAEPFELGINPHRIVFGENEVLLEFELLIANGTGAAADSIRVAYAAMSAHARQDEVIAGFHGGPPGEPGGPPFDLPAGGGGRMPVRLAIPRSGVNVVEVGGRPMFVPIVLIDLRWRGGLSIRRFGADFILGTAGQGDKLGPIWLDRPAPTGQLAANRYLAKQMAAA